MYTKREEELNQLESAIKRSIEVALARAKTSTSPGTLEHYRKVASTAKELLYLIDHLKQKNRRLEPFYRFGNSTLRPNIKFEQITCSLLGFENNRSVCSQWINYRWPKELERILRTPRIASTTMSPHMTFYLAKLIDFSLIYLKEWNKREEQRSTLTNEYIPILKQIQKQQQETARNTYHFQLDPLYNEIVSRSRSQLSVDEFEQITKSILLEDETDLLKIAQNVQCGENNIEYFVAEIASWFFGIAGTNRYQKRSVVVKKRNKKIPDGFKYNCLLRFYGNSTTCNQHIAAASSTSSSIGIPYETLSSSAIGNNYFQDQVRIGRTTVQILRKTSKEVPWASLSILNPTSADVVFKEVQDEIEFYSRYAMPILIEDSRASLLNMISCSIPDFTANPNNDLISYNICFYVSNNKNLRKATKTDILKHEPTLIFNTIDFLESKNCPFVFDDIYKTQNNVFYLMNWKRNSTTTSREKFGELLRDPK